MFGRVDPKMRPAAVALNLWASLAVYREDGAGPAPRVSDVLCSPCLVDCETHESAPDPVPGEGPSLSLVGSHRTYQSGDYPKSGGGPLDVHPVFLSAVSLVDGALSGCEAPGWFAAWLRFRWPDCGRYCQSALKDGDDPAQEWVLRTRGYPVVGGLYKASSWRFHERVAALVKCVDREFMDKLRESAR